MKMTAVEVNDFICKGIPAFADMGCGVTEVASDHIVVVQHYRENQLRPGGSISGPTLMALADTAMYALILAQLGPMAMAVTQNLNINFLRRPAPVDTIASARFLRLGRRSAVIDVSIYSAGSDEMVAHVTGTYALPVPTSL